MRNYILILDINELYVFREIMQKKFDVIIFPFAPHNFLRQAFKRIIT